MVRYKGIKAIIVRHEDKQPYREYKSMRGSAAGPEDIKEVYVEAVSEERFDVVVEIMPGFDFMSSSHVEITASFDDDDDDDSDWTISAKDVTNKKSAAALRDRQIVWDQDERFIKGSWMSYGLVFAELQLVIDVHGLVTELALIMSR